MSIKKHKIYFPIYFTAQAQLYIVIRNWPVNCNQVTVSATLLTPLADPSAINPLGNLNVYTARQASL